MPPTTVSSATVKEEDWAPTLSAVGSISAVQGAIISAELAGMVSDIKFRKRRCRQKRRRAHETRRLRRRKRICDPQKLKRSWRRQDFERARDLASQKVVSKAELDAAQSKFSRHKAAVDQMRSVSRRRRFIAPFDGQLGIRQVNVGQMINAGQQVVPLTALDPVFVDFALPQQYLGQLTPGLEVHVTTDAIPGREFDGKLTAINSMVDSSTRNVTLQATLDNPDHALRPGMFAKAEVTLPEKHKTLVVPGIRNFLRAVRRFGFRDREEERREDRQGIASDSAAICAHRRSARRFRRDYGRIEGRRHGCEHGRFQIAQRNDGDDQQRSRAETAGKSRIRWIHDAGST